MVPFKREGSEAIIQDGVKMPARINAGAGKVPMDKRIDILDSIRGLALLGILVVTINFFARPDEYFWDLGLTRELSGINYYVWAIVSVFFAGSMRGLFSVLFGTSTILLLYRLENRNTLISGPDIYYRRLVILLFFGMVDAYILLWTNDILFAYAVCGLILFPFRNTSPRVLVSMAIVLLLIPGVRSTYNLYKLRELRVRGEAALQVAAKGAGLSTTQQKDSAEWTSYVAENYRDFRRVNALQKLADYSGSYFYIAKKNIPKVVWGQSEYLYRDAFLDIFPFLLLGMALFRLGILTGDRPIRFYWGMAAIGYGIGILISWQQLQGYLRSDFDETRYIDFLRFDFYQEKRLFMTMGHLGFLILLYKYQFAKGFMRLMSRVGQMTLTNYMMQSALGALIFYGFGFGLYGKLERYELYYVVLGIWLFQILFSNLWMNYFRYGPVEWVWRSLTYMKIQPLRRTS